MSVPVAVRAAAELERRRRASGSDNTVYRADFDYNAIAWHAEPWSDQSLIHLYTGAAGGGKSRLAAEKIHDYMMRYPGAMGLMVRKTRQSMSNSTVLFFAMKIAGRNKAIVHKSSMHRFEYPNGSILAYGGMNDEEQREQIRSIGLDGGVDIIWCEEANKLAYDDYQELIPRLRGKAGPYQQMILTTNPDAPMHWINQRLIVQREARVWYSSAKDNPFNPPVYVENLKKLTGLQKQRLVDGLWVQAEGVIYDNFSVENNVRDVQYTPNMPLIWAVDDGYVYGEGPGTASYHPRVFLIAQEDGIGGVNILAERYSTGESEYNTSFDAVSEFAASLGFPSDPDVAYVDSSAAMLRGALTVRGIPNSGATHIVLEGIRNLRRMISDGEGMVLFHIHPRCVHTIEELQTYSYDDTAQLPGERKPLKMNDHGPDACRYLTYHLRFGQ